MRLLYIANSQRYKTSDGWAFPKWVKISRKSLMSMLGWKDKRMLQRVREELVAAGHIKFKAGQGADVTEYLLVALIKTENGDEGINNPQIQNKSSKGSFDTQDFFDAAVRASLGDD